MIAKLREMNIARTQVSDDLRKRINHLLGTLEDRSERIVDEDDVEMGSD
jgi:ABC-type siderophore export system fused ATPase/permease subunit